MGFTFGNMFDPLFPLMLIASPIALFMLLRIESRREVSSLLPLESSSFLALISVWGLNDWGLLIGVAQFGEGMKQGDLWKILVPSASISVVIVTGCYGFVAWLRRRRVRPLD